MPSLQYIMSPHPDGPCGGKGQHHPFSQPSNEGPRAHFTRRDSCPHPRAGLHPARISDVGRAWGSIPRPPVFSSLYFSNQGLFLASPQGPCPLWGLRGTSGILPFSPLPLLFSVPL